MVQFIVLRGLVQHRIKMDKTYYGRKWYMEIKCINGATLSVGSHGFQGYEHLKCVFDVNYPGYLGWYFSEFTIYNPMYETTDPETDAGWNNITEGAEVSFYAGYVEGSDEGKNYSQIFRGRVWQVLISREDLTDYKITLVCMDGERLFLDNYCELTLEQYEHRKFLRDVASKAYRPLAMGTISPLVAPEEIDGEKKVEEGHKVRGAVAFGSLFQALRAEVKTTNAFLFVRDGKAEVANLSDSPTGKEIPINAKTGLIGTPQQIDYGVSFRTLLNPKLYIDNPLLWVKLDLSSVRVNQQRAVIGKYLSKLPVDGYFRVVGVRHLGDTRGDAWYTDVVGYTITGKAPGPLTVPWMYEKGTHAG